MEPCDKIITILKNTDGPLLVKDLYDQMSEFNIIDCSKALMHLASKNQIIISFDLNVSLNNKNNIC